jgi:hypothetical protein
MPRKRAFRIQGKVWRYPGPAGWYFVNTGPKVAEAIRFFEDLQKVGWGYIKVSAQVGRTRWDTTLFPTKEKDFLLAIKASVRKAEDIAEGEVIEVRFTLNGIEPK